MAASDVKSVLFRKTRMSEPLRASATRRTLMPSSVGPQHGLFERSSVSNVELYF